MTLELCQLSIVHIEVSTPYFKIIPPITRITVFLKIPIPPPYRQIGHPKFSILTKMQL